jgi:hypothetical protein
MRLPRTSMGAIAGLGAYPAVAGGRVERRWVAQTPPRHAEQRPTAACRSTHHPSPSNGGRAGLGVYPRCFRRGEWGAVTTPGAVPLHPLADGAGVPLLLFARRRARADLECKRQHRCKMLPAAKQRTGGERRSAVRRKDQSGGLILGANAGGRATAGAAKPSDGALPPCVLRHALRAAQDDDVGCAAPHVMLSSNPPGSRAKHARSAQRKRAAGFPAALSGFPETALAYQRFVMLTKARRPRMSYRFRAAVPIRN